jgi:putative hydrolase of the HAD superfamily
LLADVVRRLGGEDPPEGAADELFERFSRAAAWRIYPDVVPTLEGLAERGFPMAVVSNWDSRLPGLLRELGLRAFFGPLVVSALESCEKPDPRIFHLAAGRAGVRPSEVLHVGDQDREDCQGALAAGCRAFKVERCAGGGMEAVLDRLREAGKPAGEGRDEA